MMAVWLQLDPAPTKYLCAEKFDAKLKNTVNFADKDMDATKFFGMCKKNLDCWLTPTFIINNNRKMNGSNNCRIISN